MAHTMESLSKLSEKELERVLRDGEEPAIEDVVGWEFEGWNVNPFSTLIGSRKFKKGIFGDPAVYEDPARGWAWGYNMTVEQNAVDEPWVNTPSPQNPTRQLFFGVLSGANAKNPKFPGTLVIDYRRWTGYLPIDPVGYTVDYLSYPNPGDKNLILGNSFMEFGPINPFLGYFIIRRDAQKSGYVHTWRGLEPHEYDTVRALAEIFLSPGAVLTADDVAANVDRQLLRIQSKRTLVLRKMLGALPLAKMNPADRRKLIEDTIVDTDAELFRDVGQIRTLIISGYYGDERVYPSIGFQEVKDRPQLTPDLLEPKQNEPVNVIDVPDDVIDCDVCVIGSGAGGAALAGTLAEHKDVVLLEEGQHVTVDDIDHDEGKMLAQLYKEGGLQTSVDFDLAIIQGRCLGGSTVINNCIDFEIRDDMLQAWSDLGANIAASKLRDSFQRVSKFIGVERVDKSAADNLNILGKNPDLLIAGWNQLPGGGDREAGVFKKNKKKCVGCGYCNFGCPYGRKLSMLETYVPELTKHGRRIVVGCHAVKIERQGSKATSVLCEMTSGRQVRVRAKSIVVSGGVIGSSVLLMTSGIEVRHKNENLVGTRVSFNAATPMLGEFGDVVRAFDAIQMGGYVGSVTGDTGGHKTGRYLMESHFDPPLAFAVSLPGWFETHYNRMKNYPHYSSAGVLIQTDANGSVEPNGAVRDFAGPVQYKMSESDLDKMRHGMSEVAASWFEPGARVVLPATFKNVELKYDDFATPSPMNILEELVKHVKRPDDLTLSTAHPQGGNPMSDEAEVGVVDSQFRVEGLDNLYVCDGSVFPASVGVNPQLTIMAMADYLAHLGVL